MRIHINFIMSQSQHHLRAFNLKHKTYTLNLYLSFFDNKNGYMQFVSFNSNFTIGSNMQTIFQNSMDFRDYSIDVTFVCALSC